MSNERLNERLGVEVRREGKESRYVCRVCGTKGLLVHQERGAWYCFGCEEGGYFKEGVLPEQFKREISGVSLDTVLRSYFPIGKVREDLGEERWAVTIRGISKATLLSTGCVFESGARTFFAVLHGGLGGEPGGYVVWGDQYNTGVRTYKTYGPRGFFRFEYETTKATPIYLFEGVFDLLSMLDTASFCGTFLCSFGSSLSEEQFNQLSLFALEKRVDICFDSDRVAPIVSLSKRLTSRGIQYAFRIPKEKDWNDEAMKHKDTIVKRFHSCLELG